MAERQDLLPDELWPAEYWIAIDKAGKDARDTQSNARVIAERTPTQRSYCWSHWSYYCSHEEA